MLANILSNLCHRRDQNFGDGCYIREIVSSWPENGERKTVSSYCFTRFSPSIQITTTKSKLTRKRDFKLETAINSIERIRKSLIASCFEKLMEKNTAKLESLIEEIGQVVKGVY